jgi:hypothetical protein
MQELWDNPAVCPQYPYSPEHRDQLRSNPLYLQIQSDLQRERLRLTMMAPGKTAEETHARAWEAEGIRTAMRVMAQVEARSKGESK